MAEGAMVLGAGLALQLQPFGATAAGARLVDWLAAWRRRVVYWGCRQRPGYATLSNRSVSYSSSTCSSYCSRLVGVESAVIVEHKQHLRECLLIDYWMPWLWLRFIEGIGIILGYKQEMTERRS